MYVHMKMTAKGKLLTCLQGCRTYRYPSVNTSSTCVTDINRYVHREHKNVPLCSRLSLAFLSDCYAFCTVPVYSLNGVMMSQLRHIARHKIVAAAMLSGVQDDHGRPLPAVYSTEPVTYSFRSITPLSQKMVQCSFCPILIIILVNNLLHSHRF